jgi:PST family polysaccharide transporter
LLFASLFGIDGLSLSWLCATAVVWLLNMRAINKLVQIEVNRRFDMVYPLLVANGMLLIAWGATETSGYLLHGHLSARLLGAAEAAVGVAVGMAVYLGLLLLIPLIEEKELEWLPGGSRLRGLMNSLRKRSVGLRR